MAKKKQATAARREAAVEKPLARSTPIAQLGIYDADRFAQVMSALMTDLLTGAVEPQTANAFCNAGGKLLKVVEMKAKRGGGALALASPK
jgi:hypothetical protein